MMSYLGKGWVVILVGMLVLCSCEQRNELAPVVELKWREVNSHATQHEVQRGETLYAIAFRYDQDYRQLAVINHLSSPYTVRVGQILRFQSADVPEKEAVIWHTQPHATNYAKPITWHATKTTSKPATKAISQRSSVAVPVSRDVVRWSWPIRGKVVATYAPLSGKKGIDIAGSKGEKIYAASSGVVAYAGNGLSGYGNLIIIKHDNQYLTAYGNNLHNLVKEGQRIKTGQTIAEIGVVDRRYWGVHFEIRKAGKPVNPLNYLQKS